MDSIFDADFPRGHAKKQHFAFYPAIPECGE
jgi:hypothetical protein